MLYSRHVVFWTCIFPQFHPLHPSGTNQQSVTQDYKGYDKNLLILKQHIWIIRQWHTTYCLSNTLL